MFAAAVVVYSRAFPERDSAGRWGLVVMLMLVTFMWSTGPFSPPPPSVDVVMWMCLALVPILAGWAVWIERHRGRR
jgi:hypothetical protein